MTDLPGLLPAEPPHEAHVIHQFDDAVDRVFDHLRGREPSDRVVYALTELADFSLLWHLIGWARALGGDDQDLASAMRLSVCLGIESVVVNGVVKSAFKRDRPVYQGERPHALRIPLTTSFPSGHASSAVVAAMLLSDRRRQAPIWLALAGAVAASRVHVRIHHGSDVAGGALLGLGLGLVFRKLWRLPPR